MARKKTRKTKLPRVHEMIDAQTEDLMPVTPVAMRRPFPLTRIALLVVILGLIAIFIANKGMLIAGMVNGKPIFRWELNQVLVERFGSQTLESMISEKLIADEARKNGVKISQSDIDAKVEEIVASLGGGVTVEELLKYQGMTRGEFEDQIRLQLTVETLLGRDITVTEAEIDNYIATNSAVLTATDEAGLREEAKKTIVSQRINEKLQSWFAQLKENAKILKFL